VFENPATLLAHSDTTLNQALWDLSSEVFPAVLHETIAWDLRHRFIRSFETLFRGIFAMRCAPVLGHRSEKGSPLNLACYMWWDFDCWLPSPDPLSRNPYEPLA